jgi:hypothetical protein
LPLLLESQDFLLEGALKFKNETIPISNAKQGKLQQTLTNRVSTDFTYEDEKI